MLPAEDAISCAAGPGLYAAICSPTQDCGILRISAIKKHTPLNLGAPTCAGKLQVHVNLKAVFPLKLKDSMQRNMFEVQQQ